MFINEQFESVAKELEALDVEFRTNGIPARFMEKWNVSHNVGTWNVPRQTAEVLYQLVKIKKPKTILELGTSIGYSTMWLAAAAKDIGAAVNTIDIEEYKVETAREHLERAGVSESVNQIHGDIGEALETWDQELDFVFMDANKRSYLSYLKTIEKHLSPGALVVADNVTDMKLQVEDFLDYVKSDENYSSLLLPIDHGLMLSVFNAER